MEYRIITGINGKHQAYFITKEKTKDGFLLNTNKSLYSEDQFDLKMVIDHLAKKKIDYIKISDTNPGTVILKIENKMIFMMRYAFLRNEPAFKSLISVVDSYLIKEKEEQLRKNYHLNKIKKRSTNSIKVASLLIASIAILPAFRNFNDKKLIKSNDIDVLDTQTIAFNEHIEYDDFSFFTDSNEIVLEKFSNLVQPITNSYNTPSTLVDNYNFEGQNNTTLKVPDQPLTEDDLIKFYATLYSIDQDTSLNIVKSNMDIIASSNNFELEIINLFRKEHWNDSSIDKTPVVGILSSKEKEEWIIHFANVYQLNEDQKYTLLAIHRLETGNGTDLDYKYPNNQGGIYDSSINDFATYQTAQIGCESFVRNFFNNYKRSKSNSYYDPEKSVAYNLNPTYCTHNSPFIYDYELEEFVLSNKKPDEGGYWYEVVDSIKQEVEEDYLNSNLISKK